MTKKTSNDLNMTTKHINFIENSILITVGIALVSVALFIGYLIFQDTQENFVNVCDEKYGKNNWITEYANETRGGQVVFECVQKGENK